MTRQPAGIRIIGKQIHELIAKDRQTARFEHDDLRVRLQVRAQFFQGVAQRPLRFGEETVVIERPTATQRPRGNDDVATSGFQHLGCGDGRVESLAAPLIGGLAVLTALSRIYLNRHWLSDVVAGAALGVGCAAVVLAAWERKRKPRARDAPAG